MHVEAAFLSRGYQKRSRRLVALRPPRSRAHVAFSVMITWFTRVSQSLRPKDFKLLSFTGHFRGQTDSHHDRINL